MARESEICPVCTKYPIAWCPLVDTYLGKGGDRNLTRAKDYYVCQRCWIDQHVERYGPGMLKDVPSDLDPKVAKAKKIPAYKPPA